MLTSPLHVAPSSIILTIAYALLVPLAIYRLVKPATRTVLLIRPCLFILARIVTFIMRALQADSSNVNENLMIGEQVGIARKGFYSAPNFER